MSRKILIHNTFEDLGIRDDLLTPQRQTFPTIPFDNFYPRVCSFLWQIRTVSLPDTALQLRQTALPPETPPIFSLHTYCLPPTAVGRRNPRSLPVYRLYTLQEFGVYSRLPLRPEKSRPEVPLQWVVPQRASTIWRSTPSAKRFYATTGNPFLLYFVGFEKVPCLKVDLGSRRAVDGAPKDGCSDDPFRNTRRIRGLFLTGLSRFSREPCERYGLE